MSVAGTALLVGCIASDATAQQRPLVSVVEPRVVAPVVASDTVDVIVSLRLRNGVRPRTVLVELRDIVPEPGRPEVASGGATLVPAGARLVRPLGPNARLRVRFDMARVRAGAYVLRFEAWQKGTRPARRRNRTTLTVTVGLPAPVLRPTQPLHVERVLGLGGDTIQPLTVRETTSRSQVSVTGIRQVSEESSAGTVAGELTFDDSVEAALEPGGVLRVAPTATSGFPVGTTNGTLELSAREFDAPIAVPFVVETRFSRSYLALALVLGLIAGWIARYYLQRRIDQGQALLSLESLRARVQTARLRHPDGPFQHETDDILRVIDDTLDGDVDADAVAQALAAQEKRLTDALAALAKRRDELRPRIEQRAAWLSTTRSIPGVVRRELLAVSQLVNLAGQRYGADAIEDAEHRVREANQRFESRVRGVTVDWVADVKALTDAVERATDFIGEAAEAAAQAAIAADGAAAADFADWGAALDSVASAHAAANMLRDSVGRAAQAHLSVARGAARRARMTELDQAITQLVAALEAATGTVLGAYRTAADALAQAHAIAGSVPLPAAPVTPRTGIASAAFDTGGSSWSSPLVFPRDTSGDVERRAWRRGVSKGVQRAKAVQTLIVGVVVFIVGYELFQGDFVGSVEQLVLAFLWAFTADLSLNGTVALAQQRTTALQQPPAAAQP